MKRTATLLLAGAVAAVAATPVVGYGQSRIYVPPKDSKSQLGYRDIPGLNWRDVAKHYAPAKSIDDWRKLHPERHWKEGYSAYQIAHAWENANPQLPPEIAALFYGPIELLAAIPEHKTPLPGGRAPSQSDLLTFIRIQNRVCAVTVEGKKEEGFGSTVGEWSKNASSGKVKRLKNIAAKLGLAYPPAGEIRYQLLHRAAAAVIEAERFNADCAATLVHSFSPQHESFDDFATFLSAFGIRSAKQDKIYKTAKPGIDLYFGWASPAAVEVAVAPTPAPEPVAPTPAKSEPQPETAEVAEVTAPASDKSLSGLLGGNFDWILLAVLVVAGIFFWMRTRKESGAADKPAQPAEKAPAQTAEDDNLAVTVKETETTVATGGVFKTQQQVNKEHGDMFERYVSRKFRKTNFEVRKTSDHSVDGRFSDDSTDPDFKITCKFGMKSKFAVDAKFVTTSSRGFVKCASNDGQLNRYKEYQRCNGQKTFIVLGVGKPADDPQDVYIIPVGDLTTHKMPLIQLESYKQGNKGNFYFDEGKKSLRMMRPR